MERKFRSTPGHKIIRLDIVLKNIPGALTTGCAPSHNTNIDGFILFVKSIDGGNRGTRHRFADQEPIGPVFHAPPAAAGAGGFPLSSPISLNPDVNARCRPNL